MEIIKTHFVINDHILCKVYEIKDGTFILECFIDAIPCFSIISKEKFKELSNTMKYGRE